MRSLLAAAVSALWISAALAQPGGCNRFEGVGTAGTITIDEDGGTAAVEIAGETTRYPLTSCGMGSLSYCGTNLADPEDTIALAFITGRLTATDESPADFVLLDGMYRFEAACGT